MTPTDQKCAESSTYWHVFYYRPPGKFRFTHLGEIIKMLCQELDIYILYIYMTFLIIDMDFLYQFNLGLITPLFMKSFKKNVFLNFQKLPGLWLVGEVDNHVVIYGCKVTEGFSAFQRRSCLLCSHHGIIMKFSGVITNDRSDVHAKGQGQRSKVKVTEVKSQLSHFQTITPVSFHRWWWNDAQTWCCVGEVPYWFPRSWVKFQGHRAKKKKIDFDPNWSLPDCPIAFQGRLSNFKVTGL